MEKLVITELQRDQVRTLLNTRENVTEIMEEWLKYKDETRNYFCTQLKGFTPEQFALLLCGWYEVEPKYKIGDWVIDERNDTPNVIEVKEPTTCGVHGFWGPNILTFAEYEYIRHATEEEIAQEKKRRLWANLGREIDQYRKGDLIYSKSEQTIRECLENVPVRDDSFVMVCPVEKRLDQ